MIGNNNDTISNTTQVKPARLPTKKANDEDDDTVLFGLKTGTDKKINMVCNIGQGKGHIENKVKIYGSKILFSCNKIERSAIDIPIHN